MTEELSIKLTRVRSLLEKLSLDAIYIKRQDNFAWLSCGGINYVGLGEMGNCGLLVTCDSTYAITNNIEGARMRDEEHLEDMGFHICEGSWCDNGFETQTLQKLAKNGKIGFDYDSPLGDNVLSDIRLLRFSLTDAELVRYRRGGYLASLAIEETAASIRPGESELEIIGRLYKVIREHDLDIASAMCAADERIYNYRHPVATAKRIRERVQLGGNMRYKGLIICCSRYVNFVPVSKELARQYKDNAEIDCTFIANTKPGMSWQHPFLAGKAAYEQRGYGEEFYKHHQGGPIGYQPRDYRVDFSHKDIIADNQAFCWNPSITGTKCEDTIIATSNGPEFISRPIIFPEIEVELNGTAYKRAAILEKYSQTN